MPSSLCRSLVLLMFCTPTVDAAEFDITAYGATADDEVDDTLAIRAALDACGKADGGEVVVPAGTFLISRQGAESPILEIGSNTTVRGTGDDSILKYAAAVNETNFWRMLGAGASAHDIVIRDLHLDGSNTHQRYTGGETPEQNHGVFFYTKKGRIENVTVRDCLIENFSGDCIAFSRGCRNFRIENIRLRNFVRQGIQMGGGPGDGGHVVTGCRDLEHTVQAGGSTIHVEHAEGGSDFLIEGNVCHHHLLAGGGADKLVVRDNVVHGRVEGNSISRGVFENNRVIAGEGIKGAILKFGYANGLEIRGNTIEAAGLAGPGIYIWGASRYNPKPARHIVIEDNTLEISGQPIALNGVNGVEIRENRFEGSQAAIAVEKKRAEGVVIEDNESR